MSPMRRRIAERLVEAQHETALLTTFNEIDMSAVRSCARHSARRSRSATASSSASCRSSSRPRSRRCVAIPELNAGSTATTSSTAAIYDIGVAVGTEAASSCRCCATPSGSASPRSSRRSPTSRRRARDGKLDVDELQGGTFTITNGGVYGSLLSTPIVNPPQTGVLGMHAIQDRPVARDGQVVIRPMMYVALTYDHRLVDGREAVTFLRRIKEVIEKPARLLLESSSGLLWSLRLRRFTREATSRLARVRLPPQPGLQHWLQPSLFPATGSPFFSKDHPGDDQRSNTDQHDDRSRPALHRRRVGRAAGTGPLDVIDATTEEVMGRIPEGTAGDVDRAVAAAQAAFPTWAPTPVAERAAILQMLSRRARRAQDEIGRLIAQEVGMPLPMAKPVQAGLPGHGDRLYAQLVARVRVEEQIGNSLVVREPVGVVGCITPWNYPLHQIVAKVAPALAAGCTVVLKPSEVAPLTAFILAEIVDEAGLPAGVFNLVTGTGPVVGEAIAAHPDVDMVSFTGSTRAGQARQRARGRRPSSASRSSSAASRRTSSSTTPTSRRPSRPASATAT